jgi:hypothetical protein
VRYLLLDLKTDRVELRKAARSQLRFALFSAPLSTSADLKNACESLDEYHAAFVLDCDTGAMIAAHRYPEGLRAQVFVRERHSLVRFIPLDSNVSYPKFVPCHLHCTDEDTRRAASDLPEGILFDVHTATTRLFSWDEGELYLSEVLGGDPCNK